MNNYNTTNFKVQQVNSKFIVSDPAYQRNVDFARVKNIASHFNPDLVNLVKVSSRDGKYYVFDGQHTLAALKLRNGNQDLPVLCKIYYGLTQEEEAVLFSEQNGLSRNVKTNAKLKALYTAGDTEVIDMYRVINKLGIKFDFTEGKAVNKISAAATIFKIFKKTSEKEFKDILTIIKNSWAGEPESFCKEILAGMSDFYLENKEELNIDRAIKQFSKVSPQVIVREGKLYKDGGDKRFSRQLVIAYNKNLRAGKLKE